jgi:hypothetical protein
MKRLFILLAITGILVASCSDNDSTANPDPTEQQNNNPLEFVECRNNEILYTTKYDFPLVLNSDSGFGAILMQNTYENGIGRLIFDYDIATIPNEAFKDCLPLVCIKFSNSVTSIGNNAFYGCSSLKSVIIGNNTKSIGNYAFYNCSSLENIAIPNRVTSIGSSAFYKCSSLSNISIPNSVTSIGGSAFRYCSAITKVEIGNGVSSIDSSAFANCSSLTDVYCKPTTPPRLTRNNIFNNTALALKIYVPTESKDKYLYAEYWEDYASNIIGYYF